MSDLAEQITEKLNDLPVEKQLRVLNFADFLNQQSKATIFEESAMSKPPTFYEEVISQYVGCVDSGHTDLSTNKAHMDGFS